MGLDELMRSLARELGISSLGPSPTGEYVLSLDGLEVTFVPAGRDRVTLRSILGQVPGDARQAAELLGELLRGNLARLREQGEVLCADEQGHLLLYRRLPLDGLTENEFSLGVEAFVNRAEELRGRIGKPEGLRPDGLTLIFP